MPTDPLSNALESVLKRFGALLQTVGHRRGLGAAELDELEQEVRVRLWRALSEHENITRVKTSYVYRAAMSAAVDLIRRRRMNEEPIESYTDARESGLVVLGGPETELDRQELGARIDRAVGLLAEPRDVIVRLYLSGYDRLEIAELMGWTEPKVRNLLYRGLADLRESLKDEGISQSRAG